MRKIWQWLLVILVILAGWWLGQFFNINVGGWISKILGLDKKRKGAVLDDEGNQVGEVVGIVKNHSPLRDRNVVTLESGEEIQLPDGVRDTDVERVTRVGTDYTVRRNDEAKRLTDVFRTDAGSADSG